MNWKTVKIKEWNGYKLRENKAYSKAKKLYLNRYPSKETLETLKQFGIDQIIYQNGDIITL